jgi:hypothetical protein
LNYITSPEASQSFPLRKSPFRDTMKGQDSVEVI